MHYKSRYQIERRTFYTIIVLLSISCIIFLLWFLEGIFIGTNEFDHLQETEKEQQINFFIASKYVGYITNSLILIGYIVNLVLSKRNGIGYLFPIIWGIFFLAILISPFFISGKINENGIRTTLVVLWVITFSLVLLVNIYFIYKIKQKRHMDYLEKIKIHKGGSRRG
ncbi:hypothetical protein [Mycoplasma procyoni]|uniref:hypothetical protein n=1 Tax=Mycoplasma procyoni TaxID=568784 RepID=UPI00197B3013|nr:hypothetical protein [Mycoplasma procyoni]MBN3534898.1 hypothetical protein [Mycoplasma procyoni]